MDPITIGVALVTILARDGPKVYAAAKLLAMNPSPTSAMWDALDDALVESGADLIPKRADPPTKPAPPKP